MLPYDVTNKIICPECHSRVIEKTEHDVLKCLDCECNFSQKVYDQRLFDLGCNRCGKVYTQDQIPNRYNVNYCFCTAEDVPMTRKFTTTDPKYPNRCAHSFDVLCEVKNGLQNR